MKAVFYSSKQLPYSNRVSWRGGPSANRNEFRRYWSSGVADISRLLLSTLEACSERGKGALMKTTLNSALRIEPSHSVDRCRNVR